MIYSSLAILPWDDKLILVWLLAWTSTLNSVARRPKAYLHHRFELGREFDESSPYMKFGRHQVINDSNIIFYWPFQGGTSFEDLLWGFSVLCLLCLCARLFICALGSPAGKELTSWLSFVMSNCEFVTLPLLSWVRCGTWLYRFLIFAPLFTLRVYTSANRQNLYLCSLPRSNIGFVRWTITNMVAKMAGVWWTLT